MASPVKVKPLVAPNILLVSLDICSGHLIGMNKSRRRLVHVALMGVLTNAYWVLVGNPEGRSSLGRPRGRWEDKHKQDRQCTYNVTFSHVHVTIIAVEKRKVLNILNIYIYVYRYSCLVTHHAK